MGKGPQGFKTLDTGCIVSALCCMRVFVQSNRELNVILKKKKKKLAAINVKLLSSFTV